MRKTRQTDETAFESSISPASSARRQQKTVIIAQVCFVNCYHFLNVIGEHGAQRLSSPLVAINDFHLTR